jgi:hypothetical protein
MGRVNYAVKPSLAQPAAEAALRSFAAGRSGLTTAWRAILSCSLQHYAQLMTKRRPPTKPNPLSLRASATSCAPLSMRSSASPR